MDTGQQYSSWNLTRDLYIVNIVVLSLTLKALRVQEAIARAFVAILFVWGDHESVEDTVSPKSFNSLTGLYCLPLETV